MRAARSYSWAHVVIHYNDAINASLGASGVALQAAVESRRSLGPRSN